MAYTYCCIIAHTYNRKHTGKIILAYLTGA